MPHLPNDSDPNAWARYFAMESNSRAWQLAAKSTRSEAESRAMLDAAHASGYVDVSGTTITFHRPPGQDSFSYEVLAATGDAIALRLYHNHNDFRLSFKRDGPHLAMAPGACDFIEGDCDLEFYFQRRDGGP